MKDRSDRRIGIAIFLTAFAAYMLTSGREPPWGDGNVQYMVAKSMVLKQSLEVQVPWPDDLPPGRGGKYYSTWPILTSVPQVPGFALLQGVRGIDKGAYRFAEPLTSHLACSLFGAWTCFLFFRLCRRQGIGRKAASIATVFVGFGTTVWVYSHYSYTEILQAALFTGFVSHALVFLDKPTAAGARWFGLWSGVLFGVKYIYLTSVLGVGILLVFRLRGRWRELAGLVGWSALTAVPFVILTALYNYACWGSFTQTGYHPYFKDYWGENILIGLWGIFLSPGKSVFLYSPPLILGFLALPAMFRERRRFLLVAAVTIVPVLVVYSRYKLNGDWAWGPRFAVFMVPVLMFAFALVLERWLQGSGVVKRVRQGVLASFLALGMVVQVLGCSLYWDHFIRIATDARHAWLGQPDRKGAVIPVRKDGKCDSCFEDVSHLQWLPPFQPIVGHFWLLRSVAAGRDWQAAEADAPWHRHTKLRLPIKNSYGRVRFDWWGMLWIKDFPAYRTAGWILLILFAGGTVAGALLWRRAHRAAADEDEVAPVIASSG